MKLFCLAILLSVLACSEPAKNPPTIVAKKEFSIWASEGWKIEKICIEGHVYYITPHVEGGGIAPKLNDDGTPVHCQQ